MPHRDKQILYLGSWWCQHCRNEVEILMRRGDYNKIGFNFSNEELSQELICPKCHKNTEMTNADLVVYNPPIDFCDPNDKERVSQILSKSRERMEKMEEE